MNCVDVVDEYMFQIFMDFFLGCPAKNCQTQPLKIGRNFYEQKVKILNLKYILFKLYETNLQFILFYLNNSTPTVGCLHEQ
jgi:hypothetical protein